MPRIKKAGPWNPQKAEACVGKGVLKYGDTIPAIRGSFTPVPNGPLIKKKGEFKGSTLKNGGMKRIKKAMNGDDGKLKRTRTYVRETYSPGAPAKLMRADYSVDTAGYAAGKKKFPATVTRTEVKNPSKTSTSETTIRRSGVKKLIKTQRNGGKTPAWTRSEGKDPKGGLNRKGVASYRAANPGSKLKMAVTTKPSKLKPGSEPAKRRRSFCARMSGVKGPMRKNGKPTRKALALRKWNC